MQMNRNLPGADAAGSPGRRREVQLTTLNLGIRSSSSRRIRGRHSLSDGWLRSMQPYSRRQSQARRAWLSMVRAVASDRRLMPTAIAAQMTALGYSVTAPAVRFWLEAADAQTPTRIEGFLTLARVLGLALPEESLREYYESIRIWRARHRPGRS